MSCAQCSIYAFLAVQIFGFGLTIRETAMSSATRSAHVDTRGRYFSFHGEKSTAINVSLQNASKRTQGDSVRTLSPLFCHVQALVMAGPPPGRMLHITVEANREPESDFFEVSAYYMDDRGHRLFDDHKRVEANIRSPRYNIEFPAQKLVGYGNSPIGCQVTLDISKPQARLTNPSVRNVLRHEVDAWGTYEINKMISSAESKEPVASDAIADKLAKFIQDNAQHPKMTEFQANMLSDAIQAPPRS